MNEQPPPLLPRPVRVPSDAIDADNLLPEAQAGDNRLRRRRSSAEPPVKRSDRAQAQPGTATATFSAQMLDVSKIKPEMPDIFGTLDAKAQEIYELLVNEGDEFNIAQIKYALCDWLEESIAALVNDAEWHCVTGQERFASNRLAFERALRRAQMQNIVPRPDDIDRN